MSQMEERWAEFNKNLDMAIRINPDMATRKNWTWLLETIANLARAFIPNEDEIRIECYRMHDYVEITIDYNELYEELRKNCFLKGKAFLDFMTDITNHTRRIFELKE